MGRRSVGAVLEFVNAVEGGEVGPRSVDSDVVRPARRAHRIQQSGRGLCIKVMNLDKDGNRLGCSSPGLRDVVRGMSAGSARRLRSLLARIDLAAVNRRGFPLFITLTVRDRPSSADEAQRLLKRWLQEFRRKGGLVDWVWVMEWQIRAAERLALALWGKADVGGCPHWHILAWVDGAVIDERIRYDERGVPDVEEVLQYSFEWDGFEPIGEWLRITEHLGTKRQSQKLEPVRKETCVMKYQVKHGMRTQKHLQRDSAHIPSLWGTKTGRLWGRSRSLPLLPVGEWREWEPWQFNAIWASLANYRKASVDAERELQARRNGCSVDAVNGKTGDQVREATLARDDWQGCWEWIDDQAVIDEMIAAALEGEVLDYG